MLKSFLFLALASFVQGDCPESCSEPLLLYEDLKCTPIFDESNCCPKKYDCSNLEENPKDKCVYQGKFYEAGNAIEEAYANCHAGCVCTEGIDIACAVLDCPEWLGLRPEPGCHFTYELDKCCSVGSVCPKSDETFKCKVGDETYLEGQRFVPHDKNCVTCVCSKGFTGELVEPFCKNNTCSDEIRHREQIDQHCAPAYYPDDCCPVEWICPEETDVIQPGPENPNADLKCKFGDHLLDIGATFNRTRLECQCTIPPFVTCQKSFESYNL